MSEYNYKDVKVRGDADESYLGRTIDGMVSRFMQDNKIDGLSMAIVQAPYIPRAVGYGFADAGQKRLSSINTMWPIGPISQGFTAVAIMQLYECGALDIFDSIGRYLADIPTKWQDIAVIELLRHSSGIADYSKSNKFNPDKKNKFAYLIGLVAKEPLKFCPGSGVYESATDFLLLAEIIERVSKQSYQDFVQSRQIKFLRLKHTGFFEDLNSFCQENIALTENIHELFKKDKNYIDPTEYAVSYNCDRMPIPLAASTALKGYADIWASAQDVSFWDIALAGSILIHEPKNRALIYEPWKTAAGKSIPEVAGWQFYQHKGLMDIKGSVNGYSAYLSRFTDASELVCVTLLANKENIDFTNLARRIAAAFSESIATGYNDNELYLLESQFSVNEMVIRLEKELANRHIPIFAVINHRKNAEAVDLKLRSTVTVICGSPQTGTCLMQENQSIAIELPLNIAMWKDKCGSSWIGFKKVKRMIAGYGINNLAIPLKIEKTLQDIVDKVANIYYLP